MSWMRRIHDQQGRISWKQSNDVFYRRYKLFEGIITFVLESESALSDQQSSDGHFGADVFYLHTIIEFNVMRIAAISAGLVNVESEGYFGLDRSILFVAPPHHIVSRNGWMVTDLFKINGTAINPALVSLSQNRIERFLHVYTQSILSHHDNNRIFHPFQRILDVSSTLDEYGSVELTSCDRF